MKSHTNLFIKFAPIIFVLLWATGFVGAKLGTIDAEPLFFLFVRFAIAFALLGLFVIAWLKPRDVPWAEVWHSMQIGVLLHGIYLGGVFYAVSKGMPAGVASLVVSFQPFFTVFIAYVWLGERISLWRLLFFVLALAGIFLVLFPEFDIAAAIPGITGVTLFATLLSTIAISLGAVYQKRYVKSLNLWIGTAAQYVGAASIVGIMSLFIETQRIVWSAPTVISMVWLVLVLSIGAIALLMYLIKEGDASSVASLFFLVPVVAFFMTWILFGETLNTVQIFGSILVVVSVGISQRYT